jgi:CHAT domain-containing protein
MSDGTPDDHAALEEAWQRAESLCREERWNEALDAYCQIVSSRIARIGDPRHSADFERDDAFVIERFAELSVLCGFTAAADHLLTALHGLYSRAGNRLRADCIVLKRLHLAVSRGMLQEAIQLLDSLGETTGPFDSIEFKALSLADWESRRAWPHETPFARAIFFSQFYLQTGRLLSANGQYGQALEAFSRGLHHASDESSPAKEAALWLRIERAASLLEFGDLERSALAIEGLSDEFAAASHPGAATRILELSGQLHLLKAELGHALIDFEHVLELCTRLGLERGVAAAALHLAQIYISLNRTTDARTLLLSVIQSAQKPGLESLGVRAAHMIVLAAARSGARDGVRDVQSIIEMWNDSQPAPRDMLERAHRVLDLPQAGNFLEFFEDRALGFQSLIDSRDFETAHRWLEEMKIVFCSTDSRLIHARLRVLAALNAYFSGAVLQSAQQCAALRPELMGMGLKREQWQIARLARWCEARLSTDGRAHNTELREEASRLLSEMANSLPPGHRAVYLLNKATDEEELLTARINDLETAANISRRRSWPRRWLDRLRIIRDLHQLLVDIDAHRSALVHRHLTGSSPEAERLSKASPLWKSLFLHPLRRATISFLILPDRVFAVSARWMKFDFVVRPIPRLGVREAVRGWHRRLANEQSAAQAQEIATQLGRDIGFAALIEGLPGFIRALTVVPDDCLYVFPFATLLRGQTNSRNYALTIAFERTRKLKAHIVARDRALVAASSEGFGNLPPLPNAPNEARATARWLRTFQMQPLLLLNREATKTSLIERLPAVRFAHLACHGEFNADDIDTTGLVLIPRAGEKELVTIRELAALNLSGLEHITLSACWSADNYILPGRWIISFPETLWRAGAGAVLASLWRVDDVVGAAFVRCFYEHTRKYARDEALRRTQLACIAGMLPGAENYQTNDPYFWATYTLFGAAGRLSFAAGKVN